MCSNKQQLPTSGTVCSNKQLRCYVDNTQGTTLATAAKLGSHVPLRSLSHVLAMHSEAALLFVLELKLFVVELKLGRHSRYCRVLPR